MSLISSLAAFLKFVRIVFSFHLVRDPCLPLLKEKDNSFTKWNRELSKTNFWVLSSFINEICVNVSQ